MPNLLYSTKVHVLINNAGTNFSAPFPEYPADAFSKVLDVNLVAVFRVIQLFTPLLQAAATPSSPARAPHGVRTLDWQTGSQAGLLLTRLSLTLDRRDQYLEHQRHRPAADADLRLLN